MALSLDIFRGIFKTNKGVGLFVRRIRDRQLERCTRGNEQDGSRTDIGASMLYSLWLFPVVIQKLFTPLDHEFRSLLSQVR